MDLLRQLFSRRRRYDELSETIREHLEEKIADLMDDGMTREQAEQTARREFGNVALIEERSREIWQHQLWESLFADVKFVFRQLSRSRGPAVVAVLSLAIGIGATTAIFSVVYSVLLRPLPYLGAERIVHPYIFDHSGDRGFAMLSGAQFSQLKNVKALDGAIAEDNWTMAITNEDLPQAVQVDQVSGNAIDFFGVRPILGRGFHESDSPVGQEPNHVAVLGFKFWKNHYGGRTDVIGKTLQLDRQNYTVIGIMPRQFLWGAADPYTGCDVYLPLKLSNDQSLMYPITARLKPGISERAAGEELRAIYKQFARETPDRFPADFAIRTIGIKESAIGSIRGTLWVLFGAVAALLAIGCINVGILLLARGVQRQAEFALRGALGAQRIRLVRQLLTESFVISLIGGILGIPLSFAGATLLMKWLPQGMLPREVPITISLPVLAFSIAVALITGISCGLRPALEFSRPVASQMLVSSARGTTGSMANRRVHAALIISQVAFSVLLLAAALAAVQELVNLYRTPLGYDPAHVLAVGLPIAEGSYPGWSQRVQYYDQLRQAIAGASGVSSVAIATQNLPPVSQYKSDFTIVGNPNPVEQTTTLEQVSREYFSTLRIPLLQGRIWSEAESARAAHLAVINQAMARRYWPGGNAIGQRIKIPNLTAKNTWVFNAPGNTGEVQVIGIVGNTPNAGLREAILPAVYAPHTLLAVDWLQFLVRTETEPMTVLHTIRQQIHSINASQDLSPIETAEERLVAAGWAQERFIATLFSVLAALALLLSVMGLYSVISYTVSQSAKEFGLRIALGASRAHILQRVMLSSSFSVVIGLSAGIASSLLFQRIVLRWTQANIASPFVLLPVAMILIALGALASLIPALRAASIDPMQALRSE